MPAAPGVVPRAIPTINGLAFNMIVLHNRDRVFSRVQITRKSDAATELGFTGEKSVVVYSTYQTVRPE
jgi:hypothetical protein